MKSSAIGLARFVLLTALGATTWSTAEPGVLPTAGGRDSYQPAAAFGDGVFLVAWDQFSGYGRNGIVKWPVEAVFGSRVASDGTVSGRRAIAGSKAAPAIKPTVASDGSGTVLIAYEQHPRKAEIPIRIGLSIVTDNRTTKRN